MKIKKVTDEYMNLKMGSLSKLNNYIISIFYRGEKYVLFLLS